MDRIKFIKETTIHYSVTIDGKHFCWIKKMDGLYHALHGTPHCLPYLRLSEAKEYAREQAEIEIKFS